MSHLPCSARGRGRVVVGGAAHRIRTGTARLEASTAAVTSEPPCVFGVRAAGLEPACADVARQPVSANRPHAALVSSQARELHPRSPAYETGPLLEPPASRSRSWSHRRGSNSHRSRTGGLLCP